MAFPALSLHELACKPSITALDVVRLTDALTFEGPISEAEARALFAIELSVSEKHPSWKGFFIDAIAEYAIHHSEPNGYLTAHKADWLLRQAAPQGRILSRNIFSLLTTLVAIARWVPERLVSALLDEVYCAVAAADGPMREGSDTAAGCVTARDCDIVRHVLYSSGSSGQRSITRTEAEGLLAIQSAITQPTVPLVWNELICKAIGDAALSAAGHTGPDREVYLQAELGSGTPADLPACLERSFARYRTLSSEDRAIAALERQRISIITGDDVRPVDSAWLAQAIAPVSAQRASELAVLIEALAARGCVLEGAFISAGSTAASHRAA